jgi:hypothetical protein
LVAVLNFLFIISNSILNKATRNSYAINHILVIVYELCISHDLESKTNIDLKQKQNAKRKITIIVVIIIIKKTSFPLVVGVESKNQVEEEPIKNSPS